MSLSRIVLQIRTDSASNEGSVRRRPLITRTGTQQVQTNLPKLSSEFQRACYLCPDVDSCTGIYWPETIEHVLLTCSFYKETRRTFIQSLEEFAAAASTLTVTNGIETPDFHDASTQFAVVFLCTNFADQSLLRAASIPPLPAPLPNGVRTRATAARLADEQRARADVRRRGPQIDLSMGVARQTAAWINSLLQDWSVAHRDCQSPDPMQSPGRGLAELVSTYHRNIFRARRLALQQNNNFISRNRDPPPVHPT
jgi:hypothetical protein